MVTMQVQELSFKKRNFGKKITICDSCRCDVAVQYCKKHDTNLCKICSEEHRELLNCILEDLRWN